VAQSRTQIAPRSSWRWSASSSRPGLGLRPPFGLVGSTPGRTASGAAIGITAALSILDGQNLPVLWRILDKSPLHAAKDPAATKRHYDQS